MIEVANPFPLKSHGFIVILTKAFTFSISSIAIVTNVINHIDVFNNVH